jgi:P4 family phage/plasmid primase-like protien
MGHATAGKRPVSRGNERRPGIATEAARLRAMGFAICKVDPGDKKPTYARWTTHSLEPTDFSESDWLGAMGGALSDGNRPGHAAVLIDLDSLLAVEKADAYLPATGMEEGRASKPRSHRYFLLPCDTIPEWALSHAQQAAAAAKKEKGHPGPFIKHFCHKETGEPILCFLGTGSQVVAPPSRHPSGEIREWVGGQPGEPAAVPFGVLWAAVCQLAVECGGEIPPTGQNVNGKAVNGKPRVRQANSGSTTERRIVAYLNSCPPAISGQGGHRALMRAARAVVYGFDQGPEVGYQFLRDHYNGRCEPQWSERELRHKCVDADRPPFDKPRGWLLREDSPTWNASDFPEHNGRHTPGGESPRNDKPNGSGIHLTDLGNARRVVARHGRDLHYCHPLKAWLVWDERRWAKDETAEADRRVKDTQGALCREVAAQIQALGEDAGGEEEEQERKAKRAALRKLFHHCMVWEQTNRINACLESMRSEPDIPVLPGQLDTDPYLLNVLNGTIDLLTGKLRPHDRNDLLTKLAPVEYRPDAQCPLWEQVLDRLMGRKRGMIRYLQRVVGYGLTGDVSEQAIWFFYGTGANGKSTVLDILLTMLGDYGIQAVAELLMAKHNESHPTERADLFGKRLVATIEVDQGKKLAESIMKQLTGGDRVRARWMKKDFFEFPPTHKIILAANHKPQVTGTDHANWRRIKLVPFEVTIPEAEKDKALPKKLKKELPGILAWAVRGCLDWQADGLGEPEEVRQATDAYRAEQDTMARFIAECCFVHREAKAKAGDLFAAYQAWSGDKVLTKQTFGDRLENKGHERAKINGVRMHKGIGLSDVTENE